MLIEDIEQFPPPRGTLHDWIPKPEVVYSYQMEGVVPWVMAPDLSDKRGRDYLTRQELLIMRILNIHKNIC